MRIDIITIFPHIFDSYFSESIIKRAQEKKAVDIRVHNLRDFTKDKHKKVDDRPYGGGAGMILMAEPILRAVRHITRRPASASRRKIVLLSAKGKQFTQKMATTWAKKYDRIICITGRYEGIDERVKTALRADEISIGPYVLTDGDVASMVLVSSIARLLPGVIDSESLREESGEEGLEYPHYTRPEQLEWRDKKYRVPKVLLSGNHQEIEGWRCRKRK